MEHQPDFYRANEVYWQYLPVAPFQLSLPRLYKTFLIGLLHFITSNKVWESFFFLTDLVF